MLSSDDIGNNNNQVLPSESIAPEGTREKRGKKRVREGQASNNNQGAAPDDIIRELKKRRERHLLWLRMRNFHAITDTDNLDDINLNTTAVSSTVESDSCDAEYFSGLLPTLVSANVSSSGEPLSSISSTSVMPAVPNNNSFFAPAALDASPQPTNTMPVSTASSSSADVELQKLQNIAKKIFSDIFPTSSALQAQVLPNTLPDSIGANTEPNSSSSSSSVTPLLPPPSPDATYDNYMSPLATTIDVAADIPPNTNTNTNADTNTDTNTNVATLPDTDSKNNPPVPLPQLSNATVAFFFPREPQLILQMMKALSSR
jgi:hypothetical protein